jgi:hypothetical protein
MTEVINVKNYKGTDFIYIGRGTPFGNANSHFSGELTRDESIEAYQYDFNQKIKSEPIFKLQVLSLYGKKLGCSCKPILSCHGDIIKNYLDNINDIEKEKEKVIYLIKKLYPNIIIEDILNFKNNRK